MFEYFKSQSLESIAVDANDELVLQRTIGEPSIYGDKKWVASNDCYVKDRWKKTIFFYLPSMSGQGGNDMTFYKGRQEEPKYTLSGSFTSYRMLFDHKSEFEMMELANFMRREGIKTLTP